MSAHSYWRQRLNRSKEWCPQRSHLSRDSLLQFDFCFAGLSLLSQLSCCCGQAGGAHLKNSDSCSEIAIELLLNLVFCAMGLCWSLREWQCPRPDPVPATALFHVGLRPEQVVPAGMWFVFHVYQRQFYLG